MGASEKDFRKSKKLLFASERYLSWIQVRVAAIEGVRIDYGNEENLERLTRYVAIPSHGNSLCVILLAMSDGFSDDSHFEKIGDGGNN